ncbi:MAG: hypothetical protein ACQESF_04650 [Nanobdellota archaeon]
MEKKTKNISNMRTRTHNGVDNIIDKAESMRGSSKQKITHLKEKAIMLKENARGYIQKNPQKSVLIAAGVGMAAGASLIAMIMRKKT